MKKPMRWKAIRCDWDNTIQLACLLDYLPNGKIRYVKNLVMESVESDGPIERCAEFDREEAQSLLDALYSVGLRPVEAQPTINIEALKYHLEKMRSLVFKSPRR